MPVRRTVLLTFLAIATSIAIAKPPSAGDQRSVQSSGSTATSQFTTIDAPGSIWTLPTSINPAGVIVGYYYDPSYHSHGFLRARDGTLITFDPLGAIWTEPVSINPAGAITGLYFDVTGDHGFLRARDGTFTTIDVPGAIGTYPHSINSGGIITGQYYDGVQSHGARGC